MSANHVNLPGVKHKVIGLVSGGKDSCFNLLHCVANGHEIVALATLTPEDGIDELDSHLYQSVGTRLLPLIAESMDLPLYTRVIKGKAVERGPEYGSKITGGRESGVTGDETEDLTALLQDVKTAHPEATALSSGAILSNYQRLRIEHVCQRLGLVSLAYLWQMAQMPLLDSMFSSGLEPIIVKVAGEGLGEDLVGKPLREVQPLLARLEKRFGSHPAGEGGEYETLTIDSPLFSKTLNFVESSTVITDPEPFTVAYLKVARATLADKPGWKRLTVTELRRLLDLPNHSDGLDDQSRDLLDGISDVQVASSSKDGPMPIAVNTPSSTQQARFARRGRWFAASIKGPVDSHNAVGDDVADCLESLSSTLSSNSLSLQLHSAHVTLLLSSMSLFAEANAAYVSFFGTSPPSRATVAVPLPPGQRIAVEIIGFDSTQEGDMSRPIGSRQALHVQSLSYWAPANIGPYSQAVQVNGRLHIAGQIPLLPASLTIPTTAPDASVSPYLHQSILALQHVRRIVQVLRSRHNTGGGWDGWIENCTVWWVRREDAGGQDSISQIRRAWNSWAEEFGCTKAPVIFVRAKELPRDALVEFQVNMNTGRKDATLAALEPIGGKVHDDGKDDDDDSDDDDDDDGRSRADYTGLSSAGSWTVQSCSSGRGSHFASRAFLTSTEDKPGNLSVVPTPLLERAVAVRCYVLPDRSTAYDEIAAYWSLLAFHIPCITLITVLEIHDREGKHASIALDIASG
ncbi:hypothetical protein BD324DRAFT_682050 [Kockovaella imperatae]|uniref:Diphthine--ammonia ligase n=1 Tax=Kockovaella imperatae TaxID=4999 RepID=A0A1Y1UEF9_9TREE|nr:hypothetical protein BD324DRAFT_682050 [Kockovaella imperatae]ORX35894.1 hypothetical protein BD324DRAFT_682050 [Kockovaella imperatae]